VVGLVFILAVHGQTRRFTENTIELPFFVRILHHVMLCRLLGPYFLH
jgi:hypothetical protein